MRDGTRILLSVENAMKLTEMYLLGDCTIASRFPLTVRLSIDRQSERSYNPEDGLSTFSICDVRYDCAGFVITDEREKRLLTAFIFFW